MGQYSKVLVVKEIQDKKNKIGTSLVVQWLRLHAPNAGGPRSIPGQGTRSRMLQLKILHVATKILPASTKLGAAK